MLLPLIKGLRADANAEWRDSIPVNMTGFAQPVAGARGYVRTIDGLVQFSEPKNAVDRGGFWSEAGGYHVRVIGDTLYRVGQFGDVSVISTGVSGLGLVRFSDGATGSLMLADGDVWSFNSSTASVIHAATDYIDQAWVNDYFFWTNGSVLFNSLVGDTALDAGSYAGSNFSPDPIVAIDRTIDNKLIVFNRYTTERFYNAGLPVGQFPFSLIQGGTIPLGIVGRDAKTAIGDGSWLIFGGPKERTPSFYMLTGSQYQNVSTKEIDSIMDTYADSELVNMNIEFRDTRDQSLVICHLPRHCLVYDLTLSRALQDNIWYEWVTDNAPWRGVNGVYDPRNVNESASGWIYGDKLDGRLGKLDRTVCTQYGEPLQWEVNTPLARVGGRIREMEVVTPAGHNNTTNPKLFFSTTKDGVLFGPEVLLSQGGEGEYGRRIIHRRLGDYPHLIGLKLRGYSDTITTLSGCEIR